MPDMPDTIADETQLDELLSRPSPALVEAMARLDGDIAVLGVAGKMGLSLARMAVRASREAGVGRQVYGVARFTNAPSRDALEACGAVPVRCDLMDRAAVARLPRAANVIHMAGRKFGTRGSEDLTWMLNVVVPSNVCERFAGSRIVAFSTGCVYPLVSADTGGCDESVPPAPVGDYAQSCLGRERVFTYYAARRDTPACLLRLNYAVDLRYGVLRDIADAVFEGRPVDVSAGHFNVIWQGDACAQALLCLEHCQSPVEVMNVTGPELLATRDVAARLGQQLAKGVSFEGGDRGVAYLSNASRAMALFGPPSVDADTLVAWQADWVRRSGASLGKPTHFEVGDGSF